MNIFIALIPFKALIENMIIYYQNLSICLNL